MCLLTCLWFSHSLFASRLPFGKKEYTPELHLVSTRYQSGSYVVVRKTDNEAWEMSPTAYEKFSFDSKDAERAQKLWLWGRDFIKDSPTIQQQHCFTLGEMKAINDSDEQHLKDRDTTVMVAGIFPYPQMQPGADPQGVLRVWDGTGVPPSDP